MKSVAALHIPVRPSRHLLALQWVAHAIAAGALLHANIPDGLRIFLLLLVGASLARLRGSSAVAGLILHGDGRLEKVGADGTANELVPHPHTTALPFLVVLLYRQDGRLTALTLLADSLAAEDFRQLRLWLRWRVAQKSAAS